MQPDPLAALTTVERAVSVNVEPDAAGELRDGPNGSVPKDGWEDVPYAAHGSKLYHGPPLRALRRFRGQDGRAWGRVSAPALVELAGSGRSVEGWILPCAALDACFYVTALLAWRHAQAGPSVPVSIDFLELGRMTDPGEFCLVETTFVRRSGRQAWFDFALFGNNGDLLLKACDYCIAWLDG